LKNIFNFDIDSESDSFLSRGPQPAAAAATIAEDVRVYMLQLLSITAGSFISSFSFLVHHALCVSDLLSRRNFPVVQAGPDSRVLHSTRTSVQRQSLG
jgi:hypothetical protein